MPEEPKGNKPVDTGFMREKIKQRPINRRKLLRRTVMTVSLAVIFGVVATLTFFLLSPLFTRMLNPEPDPLPVTLPENSSDDELQPEDMIASEQEIAEAGEQEVINVLDTYVFNAADYNEMYAALKEVANEAAKSVVTVTGVQEETDWFDAPYEAGGSLAGLLLADNGNELLVLVDRTAVADADLVRVTFHEGTQVTASELVYDAITGFSVLAVEKRLLREDLLERLPAASFGSSPVSGIVGTPVLAVGQPTGTPGGMIFGMVTGSAKTNRFPDSDLSILHTNMTGTDGASGILVNTKGDVVGLLAPSQSLAPQGSTQITAFGISNIRRLIEKLSNGNTRAYLGIHAADVPGPVREEQQIPEGAYITAIEMDSPAMSAGIQSGDVITRFGKTEITGYASLITALLEEEAGDEVRITLMRQGQEAYLPMTVTALLAEQAGE